MAESVAKKVLAHEAAESLATVVKGLNDLARRATMIAGTLAAFSYEDDVVDPDVAKELAWWAGHSQGLTHDAAKVERDMVAANAALRAVELIKVHDEKEGA